MPPNARTFTSSEGVTTNVAPTMDVWITAIQRACELDLIYKAVGAFDSSKEQYLRDCAYAKVIGMRQSEVDMYYEHPMHLAASIINTALDNKYPTAPIANRVRAWRRYNY